MQELQHIDSPEVENQLLESFGERFLEDAIRIIGTRTYTALDEPLVHEAMCIIVAMYIRKVKLGEINQDKVLH